jgi:hypothetical protein
MKISMNDARYREAQNALRYLRRQLPPAAVSAMQKTITRVVSILTDETAKVLNLTKGRIKDDITVSIDSVDVNPDSANPISNFKGRVDSTGDPIGLIQFATNIDNWNPRKPKPVNVKIFKTSGKYTFGHVFIAKGKGKSISTKTGDVKLHMWQRDKSIYMGKPYIQGSAYWKLPHEKRYPLNRMTTARIQDIQSRPDLIGEVLRQAGNDAIKGLREEMDVVFTQAGSQ